MKCLICGSDDTTWQSTTMEDEDEGYESYSCGTCRSTQDIGIKIIKIEYTGKDDVCPCEEE